MGFMAPTLPDVDIETWRALPRGDRVAISARHWVEHGFGSPTAVYLLYVVKCALLPRRRGAGHLVDARHRLGLRHLAVVGRADRLPEADRLDPALRGDRPGLRLGPADLASSTRRSARSSTGCARAPSGCRRGPTRCRGTRGDRRTVLDVALYAAVLASAGWLLTRPGDGETIAGFGSVGFLDPWEAVPLIVSLALLGLRDQTIFLAARGEQYWLSLLVFFFPYVDMFIGFKLVMLALWWGAATSKLNHHFPFVVATMMSNAPLIRSRWLKRKMYRNPPEDLQPPASRGSSRTPAPRPSSACRSSWSSSARAAR